MALAGPVMNVITALSIPLAGALMYGVPMAPAPVRKQHRRAAVLEAAGLQRGDQNRFFQRNRTSEVGHHSRRCTVVSRTSFAGRGRTQRSKNPASDYATCLAPKTVKPSACLTSCLTMATCLSVVREVTPDSLHPKQVSRLAIRLVAIGGQPVHSAEQVTQYISEHKGPSQSRITLQARWKAVRLHCDWAKATPEGKNGLVLDQLKTCRTIRVSRLVGAT